MNIALYIVAAAWLVLPGCCKINDSNVIGKYSCDRAATPHGQFSQTIEIFPDHTYRYSRSIDLGYEIIKGRWRLRNCRLHLSSDSVWGGPSSKKYNTEVDFDIQVVDNIPQCIKDISPAPRIYDAYDCTFCRVAN